MSNLTVGAAVDVPELPGRWSVWSACSEAPGAVFVVPADDKARSAGIKFAVVKAIQKAADNKPTITVVRTDPSIPTPTGAHR